VARIIVSESGIVLSDSDFYFRFSGWKVL